MKKRELGKSGILVSEIGLGCMSLPTNVADSNNIIDAALEAGITYFDTADLYDGGKNEEILGQVLKNKRDQIILATKAGNKLDESGENWTWDSSKQHITTAIKKSLQRLQTDYIDLYQLHGGTMDDNVFETIEAFESLKREGVIREYGISSIRPTVIKRFLENSSAVSVMMQYNLLDRRPEEWFPMIHAKCASVITRGTIAKGFLTDEGIERSRKAEGFVDYVASELRQVVQELNNHTTDMHAAAIAFALHDHTVASALVGPRTTDQLMDTLSAYETGFPSEKLNELAALVKPSTYNEHRP
jgi:aryl-alcohol dehydrogenase-like predicted oxidoreductase